MQKIYIDFDGTLFNTDELYDKFRSLCISYRISNKDIESAMEDSIKKYGMYSLEKILKILKEKYKLDDKIVKDFQFLFSSKFVYEDVREALEVLTEKYEVILLTYGDKDQWHKIECSGLKKYFSSIIVTDKKKDQLKDIDYNNSIFIDNNVNDLLGFFYANAKKVIRIRRESDKYSKIDTGILEIPEYKNFLELVKKEFI